MSRNWTPVMTSSGYHNTVKALHRVKTAGSDVDVSSYVMPAAVEQLASDLDEKFPDSEWTIEAEPQGGTRVTVFFGPADETVIPF
jgi:hypothetical protein